METGLAKRMNSEGDSGWRDEAECLTRAVSRFDRRCQLILNLRGKAQKCEMERAPWRDFCAWPQLFVV